MGEAHLRCIGCGPIENGNAQVIELAQFANFRTFASEIDDRRDPATDQVARRAAREVRSNQDIRHALHRSRLGVQPLGRSKIKER